MQLQNAFIDETQEAVDASYVQQNAALNGLGNIFVDDALAGLGRDVRAIRGDNAKSLASLAEPGNINKKLWPAVKAIMLGEKVDITKYTVYRTTLFDHLGIEASATPFVNGPWRPFENRAAAIPYVCNTPELVIPSDAGFVIESISLSVPQSMGLSAANAISYLTADQTNAEARVAAIEQIFDIGEWVMFDGTSAVKRGPVSQLADDGRGPWHNHAIGTTATTGEGPTLAYGRVRNGPGRAMPLDWPFPIVNGRVPRFEIQMPSGWAAPAAISNIALRFAINGIFVRGGGLLAT
jgi:hypothetical protein